mmetsp:Transcript_41670/g.71327  ORF Transcript_41670/g.71327 Transcript_41670/m.71327 type:complete len:274 (+) Transcript_41670:1-822(+)
MAKHFTSIKKAQHENLTNASFSVSFQNVENAKVFAQMMQASNGKSPVSNYPLPKKNELSHRHSLSSTSVVNPVDAPQKFTIPSPTSSTNQTSKFEKHTMIAVQTLQTSKKFSEVFKAVMKLEKITQHSMEDCNKIVEADGHNKMFSIIRGCNRSSPHAELMRAILRVLANLSQHPSILSRLASVKALDTLTDLVHLFRDKASIFALSSSLLENMLCSSYLLISEYSTPEKKKRVHGILLMSKKKSADIDDMQEGIQCLENILCIMNSTSAQKK